MTNPDRAPRPVRVAVSLPLGPGVGAAAARAERLGFDYVSVGEHLSFHGPTANGFVSLAAAAGATTRIGLLSSVTLVPLYPAVLLAKLVTSLDDVSGGRFTLGVGVGGENDQEFGAVGVERRHRGRRTDEALDVLRRLSDGPGVTVDGRFTQVDDLTLAPRPARPVPVWVAGRSAAAMRRASRHDGWMPYMVTPDRLAATVADVRRFSEEEGRGPWQGRVACHLFTTVDPDPRAARRLAVEHVGATYRQDFEDLADRYLVHGDAAGCTARIREYVAAGADTVVLRLAPGPRGAEHLMEVLAHEVLPGLRPATPRA